eukprot:5441335-Amphidinium_carterae.1
MNSSASTASTRKRLASITDDGTTCFFCSPTLLVGVCFFCVLPGAGEKNKNMEHNVAKVCPPGHKDDTVKASVAAYATCSPRRTAVDNSPWLGWRTRELSGSTESASSSK